MKKLFYLINNLFYSALLSTMTIQSLCSAIRSQLYFSQISSWVDLLKKAFSDGEISVQDQMSNIFSPEIMQNPRLKKNLQTMQVDLDILFRIKSYDGASAFNDKPNVHNFPDTIISDRMALRVCLKSLPRLEKIPTLNTEKANINGFSCDNRIRTLLGTPAPLGSPVAGSSCHLLHDRLDYPSCHEKGKHRCKEEDEEEFFDDAKESADELQNQSPTAKSFAAPSQETPSAPCAPSVKLSHRERQLLKYKKRLMKRDKQKKKGQDCDGTSISSLNTSGSEDFDKLPDAVVINDTFAPLYGADETNPTANTIQKSGIFKTLSIATQTDAYDDSSSCNSCGETLQCWNCDKTQNNFSPMTSSSVSTNIGSAVGTMIGNKGDLLLQALQRTANAHPDGSNGVVARDKTQDNIFNKKSHHGDSPSATQSIDAGECDTLGENNNYLISNNNNVDGEKGEVQPDNDCRLCKRQKTRHNYTSSMSVNSNSSSGGVYRRTMSECLVGMSPDDAEDETDGAMHFSPLPVHNCDDAEFNYASNSTPSADDSLSYGELKAYRRAFSEDVINQLPAETCCFDSNEDDDCLTIKCKHCKNEKTLMETPAVLKLTPNVTLQQARPISSMSPHKKLLVNGKQKIPKINLSHVFDNIQDDSGIVQDTPSPTSDNVFAFNSSPANSYPPTMMQLSPRFIRGSSSMLKRRSRHISDRSSISEYSNFSDDDENEVLKVASAPVESLSAPPKPSSTSKISSLYKKFVTKTHAAFNKLPLLGSIEESLLRDRYQPKAILSGFKLLLGASGSFCPTQLTLPAQTFFYEFHGLKHMSTPYVVSFPRCFASISNLIFFNFHPQCEFRLSRKGYSIPRAGTVQATLLNPQGTVVRMFFVPYDFRDMPAMSQTFIRQRVLAIDEHVSQKEAEQMSTVEQMKHLRYVVHLR